MEESIKNDNKYIKRRLTELLQEKDIKVEWVDDPNIVNNNKKEKCSIQLTGRTEDEVVEGIVSNTGSGTRTVKLGIRTSAVIENCELCI